MMSRNVIRGINQINHSLSVSETMRRIFAQGFDFLNQSARVNASSKGADFKFIDLSVTIVMIERYQVLRKNGIQELMFLTPAIEKRSRNERSPFFFFSFAQKGPNTRLA